MACSRLNALFEEEGLSDYAREPLGPLPLEDIPEPVQRIQGLKAINDSNTQGEQRPLIF